MAGLLITNGRVVDPSQGIDEKLDVLIEDGKIKKLAAKIANGRNQVFDAEGKLVVPGLIDMHVHLREPGMEEEETIASGSRAAINGGFATIVCMPNTDPAVDNEASAEFVFLQAARAGGANIYPAGSITKGRKGEELAEMGQLSRAGAVAFTDDGSPVANAYVLRRGMEYAKMFNRPIISHCEDMSLAEGGMMNEGYVSTNLGLPGMPTEAESTIVHRDIMLARLAGVHLHVAHVSTAQSIDIIRRAKADGAKITAETAPHYFLLTDENVRSFDTNFKMNPPLRTQADIEAILEAINDGTLDVIASDHAPHTIEEKEVEFNQAPFGIIGMESMLPLILTHLVGKNIVKLDRAIAMLSCNPASILGLKKGSFKAGYDGDVTIIDMKKSHVINVDKFKSKSRNCPFHGWKVKGCATTVVVGGKIVEA